MGYIYDLPEFKIPKEFQDGLVGAWNGQQASDGSVVDLSGNGYNGTENGGVVFSRKNNAHFMQFDGSDDYVQIGLGVDSGVVPDDRISDYDLAIFAVVKGYNISDSSGINEIYMNYHCSTDSANNKGRGLSLMFNNDVIEQDIFIEGASSVYEISSNTKIQNNKTYYISFVKKGTEGYLYINGNLDNSITFSDEKIQWTYSGGTAHTGYNTIGVYKIDSTLYYNFNGEIPLTLTYNKILSPKQIQKMYEYFRQWYND